MTQATATDIRFAEVAWSGYPAPQTQLLELDRCGHSPHRDRPEVLIQAVADFLSVARHPAG